MNKKKRSYVELFAGCGGMSLGIESEGFERLFANELSPMPAATYSFNLIHHKCPVSTDPESWYRRLYSPDIDGEYNTDPRTHINKQVSELAFNELQKFNGSMFVGGINQLNQCLRKIGKPNLKKLEVDLLSGGPPCQSFSLAGRRERNNPRNDLPFEFAESASLLSPKVVLLENVSGILHPFKDSEGVKWYAWFEVAKAFWIKGYVPVCTHAEAQKYGVPQRRPRFLMVAIRKDIADRAIKVLDRLSNGLRLDWQSTRAALEEIISYFEKFGNIYPDSPSGFRYYEPNIDWPQQLLPLNGRPIDVQSVIDSLTYPESRLDKAYLKILAEAFPNLGPTSQLTSLSSDELKNREYRKHSLHVKARFRILRLLAERKRKSVDNKYLQSISEEDEQWLLKQDLIFPNDCIETERIPKGMDELKGLLESLQSRKHSQRALLRNRVAPAQLSIPDDSVHYASDRTLTVREMARIQSFPDWFEFKGKVTTGGNQRAYEVPRYTQVGNAVPPLMAKQIAKGIRDFLDLIGE